MNKSRTLVILVLVSAFVLLLCSVSIAQVSSSDPLAQGVAHYDQGQFELALQDLNQAQQQAGRYSKSDQLKLRKYMGLTFLAFNEVDPAVNQFYEGLRVDNQFYKDPDLDPAVASPKVVEAVEKAKAMYVKAGGSLTPVLPPPPPPVVVAKKEEKPKEEEKKPAPEKTNPNTITGIICASISGASLITSGALLISANQKYNQYQNETDQNKRKTLEDDIGTLGKTSIATTAVGVLTGGLSVYFFVKAYKEKHNKAEIPVFYAAPLGNDGAMVAVQFTTY